MPCIVSAYTVCLQVIKAVEMGCCVTVTIGGVVHTSKLSSAPSDYAQTATTGSYKQLRSSKEDPQCPFAAMDGVGPWKDAMKQDCEHPDNRRVSSAMVRFFEVMQGAAMVSALAVVSTGSLAGPCTSQAINGFGITYVGH